MTDSGFADVNGTTIHYVRAGQGPALVLLHGFPQDWYEWRHVIPRLAQRYTVIAADLRGVGGSTPTATGYTVANMAEDIRQLIETLDVGAAHVVGHDVGGGVGYALARLSPECVRSLLVLETPIPGIEPWLELDLDVPMWHGEFHMVPGLPEALVDGRQATYFRYFFDVGTTDNSVITDADVQHYAEAYGDVERLHAAFEMYRATPANIAWIAERTSPVDVPLLLVGGEQVFGPPLPELAANLRANYGWSAVDVHIVPGGRHYLVEERPAEIAELIERHAC